MGKKQSTAFPAPSPPERPDGSDGSKRREFAEHDLVMDEVIRGVDLSATAIGFLRFVRCELRDLRLTGAQLQALELVDVLLVDCELSGSNLHAVSMQRVALRNCRMTGVVLSDAELAHVRLVDCKVDDANLRFTKFDTVCAESSSFVRADLYQAQLRAVSFDHCDLTEADLSKVVIDGAKHAGLRLTGSTVESLHSIVSRRSRRDRSSLRRHADVFPLPTYVA